jgi:integrase
MRSKHQARAIEAAKRTDLVKGLAGLSAPTLNEFVTRFVNALPGRVSKQTFMFYVRRLHPLMDSPALCDCRLDRIQPALIQDFVGWRRMQKNGRGGTISPTTVSHNLRTLRRALHLAAEWNVIAKVPKIKLLPGENQRDYLLTDEAIERFSQEPGLIGRLVSLLADTGLRRGEVCALTWDAVNFTEGGFRFGRARRSSHAGRFAHETSRGHLARSTASRGPGFPSARAGSDNRQLAVLGGYPQVVRNPKDGRREAAFGGLRFLLWRTGS